MFVLLGLYSDTFIITKDKKQRRSHSFVLGVKTKLERFVHYYQLLFQASSSLMKAIFDDISSKVLDSDYGIIMPDYTADEVDSVLRNIYGLESSTTELDPFTVDFNEKDRTAEREKVVIRKPKVEQEENLNGNEEDYQFSHFEEVAATYDVKPVVKSKKRGRTKYIFIKR